MMATLHEAMAAYPFRIDAGPSARHEQLVHNEFRSANLLHDGTRITAVLDFEEVTYRPRVADLAKASVLLGTRYRDWSPTDQRPGSVRRGLLRPGPANWRGTERTAAPHRRGREGPRLGNMRARPGLSISRVPFHR